MLDARVAVLRTYSASCDPIVGPLGRCVRVMSLPYCSERGLLQDRQSLCGVVHEFRPNLIVVLGNHDDGKSNLALPVATLSALSVIAPMVHICCDGSEAVWWPQLEEYSRNFEALHINIDGVRAGFFAGHSAIDRWTTLCPIDEASFPSPPPLLRDRPIRLGFCGGWGAGHPRGDDIEKLVALNAVAAVKRPFEEYGSYVDFLTRCRAVFNHAHSGTADHMHVKARVVETALAGAVLVEPFASPTHLYFERDVDYLSYTDLSDMTGKCENLILPKAIAMASNLRKKVLAEHTAEKFWKRIFARCLNA
jgi:hypothetical protein